MRRDAGFTLVETLVAMVAGLAVTGALFAVLEVSLHQTARLTDVAQATQLGRDSMTRIVDELHSACFAPAPGFKPVQEGSTASKLIVVDAFSEAAEIPGASTVQSEGAREDEIVWSEKALGTLTDYTHLPTAGTVWPEFTFAKESTGTVIGEGVSLSGRENAKKEALPIFTYYKYAEKPSTGSSSAASSLNELEPLKGSAKGLSKEEAEQTASVAVNFKTAPASGLGAGSSAIQTDANADLTGQVTFAFSAPNSEATVVDSPCK